MEKNRELFKFLGNINESRLKDVVNNNNLKKEVDIISRMDNGKEYYKHIINNIDIDRKNINNSYIMWLYDKVDDLNLTKPVSIVEPNISLPDIDTDFPANRREEVIEYIREKYGKDKVCQIATFGTLKGKAALKEVFRVCEVCDFETINLITKPMPNEADIADELEEQGEESIISWCLRNQPKMFKDYCYIEGEEFKGEYAKYFQIAIELEGIHKSQGKHAAGLIVSGEPLADIVPLIYDKKTGEAIVALDKKDAEKIGLVKFDILGLSCLDKLMSINNLLRTGKV